MKKFIFSIICTLLPILASAQEPYAALSENNTVLTFYYDDQKATRGGMDVGPFTEAQQRGWDDYKDNIQTVVFDESFANCTITSTSHWFYSSVNSRLTTITGLENLKTDNVTDMSHMFEYCTELTSLDLSGFNTSKVTDMSRMFYYCSSLTTIYAGDGWSTNSVTEGSEMFTGCGALIGGAGIKYDNSHTDYTYAHIDEGAPNPGYLSDNLPGDKPYAVLSEDNTVLTFYYDDQKAARGGWGVGPFNGAGQRAWDGYKNNIQTVVFDESFANCTITSTSHWFYSSVNSRLTTITGLENLKTDNVTDMSHMFEYCTELTSLDLSGFNTSKVTDMSRMFYYCSSLTTIYAGDGWSTNSVTEGSEMFTGCGALIGGAGIKYDNSHTDYTYAHIDGGTSNPGYLTDINGSSEASQEAWAELQSTIEHGTDVLSQAKGSSSIDSWLVEELDMTLNSANEMYNAHTASEEEVRNMIEDLKMRIQEVEEAMNQPASEEAWAELHDAVDRGDKLLTEAREAGTVEQWALEELENRTVEGSLMYEEHKAGEEEVRHATEELNHIIWEVEEMMHHDPQGEAYFQNYTAYVYGNATLDDAFAEVGRETAIQSIAAIVWDADSALTAEMLNGITNPNLLVYVTEASKAPAGVQNVVINGVAEEIILTDATGNNNFYCPQSFTARSISYSRDFSQTTEIEVCRGWETIALPFDVQSITHESHGVLTPFGGESSGYQFWLRQLSDNGLARATRIEANRPYLISMPNNSIYPSVYNQNGKVTFSASDVTVPETMPQSDSYAGVTLYATFQQVAQGSSIYALNVGEARGEYPEGSMFEQNYRDIRPFQAYTTHTAGTRGIITLESLGGNDNTTGIEEIRMNSELRDSKGPWYSLDGRRLDAEPTKKGIYVKDGRKFVIK